MPADAAASLGIGRAIGTYAITLLIFFAIDLVWLGVVAKNFYRQHIGHLMSPDVNWGAAILFYAVYIAGIVFFTNFGIAYTCRIIDVPASTGYGEPIQRLFKFKDGERVVAVVSLDPRLTGPIQAASEGVPPPLHALAVTSDGYSLRFGLEGFAEPSTRSGRRYARPAEGAEVVGVVLVRGDETVLAATKSAHAMVCGVEEINYLAGPGKGVILVKLRKGDDRVLGFTVVTGDRQVLTVETSRGALQTINTGKYEPTGRGGRGRELLQRGEFVRVVPEEVPAPPALAQKEE